jgi:AsmA-like C-terminal region/Protein of unknown function
MDARSKQSGDRASAPSSVASSQKRDREWEHRLLWVLVLAVLGLMTFFYLSSQVDRRLRNAIISKISERYPTHIVELDRVHLEEGRALLLEGFRISAPTPEGIRPVIKTQRVIARGKLELMRMLTGHTPIDDVVIDGLELSIWPTDDKQWSFQTLIGKSESPVKLPRIEIRSGLLRLGQSAINGEEMVAHDLKVEVRPHHTTLQAKDGSGAITSTQNLFIRASVAASHFRQVSADISVDLVRQEWNLQGECKGLAFSDRLFSQLPVSLANKLQQISGLRCEAEAVFKVWKNHAQDVGFEINGNIEKGRMEHPRIPYLLESLRGQFACKNNLIQFRQVEARNGPSMFWFDADIFGLSPQSPMVVNAKTKDLQLDERLYQSLPKNLQDQWQKFRPTGTIDANVSMRFDGQKWSPHAIVRSKNVSIELETFPIRVQQLSGNFTFENDTLKSDDVVARVRGQTVRASVTLEKAIPRWAINLQMSSDGPIAIQEELLAALTPRGQPTTALEKFARSLQPTGNVHLERASFIRTKENNDVLSKSIEMSFYEGTVQYQGFRYPIFNVQGHVVVDNDLTLIQNMRGRNDSARIQCYGRCISNAKGVEQLALDFDSYTVPLEEELHRALPNQMATLWDQIQPSGVIDHVQVKLQRDRLDQPIDLEVIVDEDGKSDLQAAQTVSIRPTAMPMLLDNIACNLVYRPGRLTVMHLSGSRDLSRVKSEGSCWIRNDGSWDGTLTWLPGTRLIIDQNLISNLPHKLGQPLTSLDFHGPVNVMGWTHFVDDSVTQHPYANAWDLRLDIEDGRLGQGQVVSGIRGAVLLEGETRSDGPVAVGNFDLDSLALRGVPVIGLRGGFALQNGQTFFGREASVVTLDRKRPMNVVDSELKFGNSSPMSLVSVPKDLSNVLQLSTPHSPSNTVPDNQPMLGDFSASQKSDVTAQIAGGRLSLHGTGQVATGRTNLRIELEGVSLKEALQEFGQPNLTTTGKVNAQLQLAGSPANINTISGTGTVQIREAQLYELPSLARLMRLLSIRPPDDSAFESADIEFRIDGDRIPLERLSLDGDIISLRGSGWTNLRREIHLDLYTYIGQKSRLAAMFGPVLSHNDASLLYIEVDGTLDKFAIQKKLPMLESTLEQVFPEKAQIPASQRKNSRISPSGP